MILNVEFTAVRWEKEGGNKSTDGENNGVVGELCTGEIPKAGIKMDNRHDCWVQGQG